VAAESIAAEERVRLQGEDLMGTKQEETSLPPPLYRIVRGGGEFCAPANRRVPIWRYMSLSKFLSLLERRALFFCRGDKLGDPFEGSINAYRLDLRRKAEAWQRRKYGGLRMTQHSAALVKSVIINTLVNCWHVNEVESAAMWAVYGAEGVALRSTYGRLVSAIRAANNARISQALRRRRRCLDIHIGAVKYIDFTSRSVVMSNPFFCKRLSFEHERELRAVVRDYYFQGDPRSAFPEGGDYIPVQLSRLVETIHLSPDAPAWFVDVVQSAVKRYGFDFPVHRSDMMRDPIH
jgi:hypothetical protein